jgi:hypothetical protein
MIQPPILIEYGWAYFAIGMVFVGFCALLALRARPYTGKIFVVTLATGLGGLLMIGQFSTFHVSLTDDSISVAGPLNVTTKGSIAWVDVEYVRLVKECHRSTCREAVHVCRRNSFTCLEITVDSLPDNVAEQIVLFVLNVRERSYESRETHIRQRRGRFAAMVADERSRFFLRMNLS